MLFSPGFSKLICNTSGCSVEPGQCVLYILVKERKLSYAMFTFSLPTTVCQEFCIKSCVSVIIFY